VIAVVTRGTVAVGIAAKAAGEETAAAVVEVVEVAVVAAVGEASSQAFVAKLAT
jgi:hypothetical protein